MTVRARFRLARGLCSCGHRSLRVRILHHTASVPDVLRVEGAGLVRFAGALDDRAAVLEHRELVRVAVLHELELQKELVVTYFARLLQYGGEVCEVELALHAMAHLHRVAPAEGGGLRAVRAVEPLEVALRAA